MLCLIQSIFNRTDRGFAYRRVLVIGLLLCAQLCGESQAQQLADLAEKQKWDEIKRGFVEYAAEGINKQQRDGMTPIHWAVFHGHIETIDMLLRASADVDVENKYGVRPLFIACGRGDEASVDLLLQAQADANAVGPSGETPLMIAARQGSTEVARLLLGVGAKPNVQDRAGQTALMWAAAAGNADVLQLLIENDADFNQSLPSGFNAFFFAVRQGHAKVVEAIIEAGVDVNQPMDIKKSAGRHPLASNTSALMLAVENGHFELALQLVDHGADPNDQRSGFAPLHVISWVRKPDRGEDVEPPVRGSGNVTSLEFVKRLVELGADVNLPIEKGRAKGKAKLNSDQATPILYAAKTADSQLMKLLVELGADIHTANADGVTPLLAAAGVGVTAVDEEAGTEAEVLEAIGYLLAQGANIDTVSKRRDTAMHGAAFRAFPRVIHFLRDHGLEADVWKHKDDFGWSPFDIADGKRPGSVKPNPTVRRALQDSL